MPVALQSTDRQDLARTVGRVKSGCRLVNWAVEMMNEGLGQPTDPGRRMELYEGLAVVLELMAGELERVQRKLSLE